MRILKDEEHYKKWKHPFGKGKGYSKDDTVIGRREYIRELSKELEISKSNIYQCLKFAEFIQEKYEGALDIFIMHYKNEIGDKPISWFYITQNLLYEHRPTRY